MIYCIGDSHASIFSGNDEIQPIYPELSNDTIAFFKSYRIGPATAYNIISKKNIINEIISKNNLTKNDYIMFCFGEVDCRAHLLKQSNIQKKSVDEIVKECVNRYFDTIFDYHNLGYNVLVWGPIGSWNDERKYTGVSYGSCYERNMITKLFNDYLMKKCDEKNIIFLSIFYDMLDENLITNSFYLDDFPGCHIHLSKRAIGKILEKFEEKKII